MNIFNILAEVEPEVADMKAAVVNDIEVVPIDFIWEQINTLSWFHAVLAISFGVVYLLYGWRIFKALTVICFGLIGMFFGISLAKGMGNPSAVMWGGFFGLIILASLSVPLMKYCISLLGAIAGGILTGAVWVACGLPDLFLWAGALAGVIFGDRKSVV